jgi:tetratricopeptide (TPR) repeat protein
MTTVRAAAGDSPSRRRPIRVRPGGIVLAALLVAGLTYGAAWLSSSRDPSSRRAASDAGQRSLGAEALNEGARPPDLAAIDAQIAIWSAKSAADARDDISASNLGVLYLGRGRLTGDAADYERALAAANRAVAAYPTSTATRALKATVLQATHDFRGALNLAETILREDRNNVDALAVAGDAKLEMGRLDEAGATYATIAGIAPGPALDVRLARLAWLSGDTSNALNLVARAREAAIREGAGDPSFYEAQLGEFARITGDAARARKSYLAALAIRPTDQLALLGLARLDAFAGDDAAAIAGLRLAAAIAPRPETLALLSDLLTRTGDTKGAADTGATVRFTEKLGGTGSMLFDRQFLLFELDHGGATGDVLVRAKSAAQVRPDAAGLDVVAWAAYRLGDLRTAREFSARALASGTVDARILYHASAIALSSGEAARGRALVERALGLGPALDPIDRGAALALIGD